MRKSINSFFLIWLFLYPEPCLLSKGAAFPGSGKVKGILNQYIEAGLENNLVLQQERFSLKKGRSALKEARGMFLPKISLEARYSRAGGGRMIEIPVGELMNPVYQSLNSLLQLNGLEPVFPDAIGDEMIPFLRPREHETKLRIIQPIFQPQIFHYVKIRSRVNRIQQARINAFRRELVAEIKTAYYTYLKTLKIRDLLSDNCRLLRENLRISQSLFENHKVTQEVVFRSRAELSRLDQQLAEAEKNITLSAAHFNFLLNRPLSQEIQVSTDGEPLPETDLSLESLEAMALNHRDEFAQARGSIQAATHHIRLQKSLFLPSIAAVLDYGFQGEAYRFSDEDDYWMASLVLSWNLFNGFQDAEKTAQARIEKQKLQVRLLELEQQIRMQVQEAFHNLVVARETIKSSTELMKSCEQAFFIVSKKYEQGMVPQVEYIQARNEYTRAGIHHIISKFDCRIMEARLEWASATYPLADKESKK